MNKRQGKFYCDYKENILLYSRIYESGCTNKKTV